MHRIGAHGALSPGKQTHTLTTGVIRFKLKASGSPVQNKK
jgi:hypothetical protein